MGVSVNALMPGSMHPKWVFPEQATVGAFTWVLFPWPSQREKLTDKGKV